LIELKFEIRMAVTVVRGAERWLNFAGGGSEQWGEGVPHNCERNQVPEAEFRHHRPGLLAEGDPLSPAADPYSKLHHSMKSRMLIWHHNSRGYITFLSLAFHTEPWLLITLRSSQAALDS
jgi:hypothetical protein